MRSLLFALFCLWGATIAEASVFVTAHEPKLIANAGSRTKEWGTNYEQALATAQERDSPVLIAFVGSSWCPWSKKLITEVLSKKAFTDALKNDVVFLWVDFPMQISSPSEESEERERLKQKYQLEQLPTLVVTTKTGEEIGKLGFMEMSPQEYVSYIQEMVQSAQHLSANLHILDEEQLKPLYLLAQKKGMLAIQKQILQAGLKVGKTPFFLLEKYGAALKTHSSEKTLKKMRKQIVSSDPHNEKKACFQLAMLDFEYRTNDPAQSKNIQNALKPLLDYIKKFGTKDVENGWKAEKAISQFLFSKGKIAEALKHAKISHALAPDAAKEELAGAIKYLTEIDPSREELIK